MKNKLRFILALVVTAGAFFALGALTDSQVLTVQRELDRQYWQAQMFTDLLSAGGMGFNDYGRGYFAGYAAACNSHYNLVARTAGTAPEWIERP